MQRSQPAHPLAVAINTCSMMKHLDEIIYDALKADETLVAAVGNRIVSTCFEIPPTEEDNTPIPNIIITDEGLQNQQTTKDNVWEAMEDRVQVGVDIAAASPGEVNTLVRMVRNAIEQHISMLYASGEDIPYLEALTSEGISWDWMKPCYFSKLTYQCIVIADHGEDIDEEIL